MKDLDGNKLYNGTRVAAADNVHKITMKVGKIIGFTEKRVRIQFEGEIKPSTKAPHTLIKVFIQEK